MIHNDVTINLLIEKSVRVFGSFCSKLNPFFAGYVFTQILFGCCQQRLVNVSIKST